MGGQKDRKADDGGGQEGGSIINKIYCDICQIFQRRAYLFGRTEQL